MSCPYCGEKNYLDPIAESNVMTYKSSALSATLCCKQPIRVSSHTAISVTKTETKELTDSWGNEFIKPTLKGLYALVKYDLNLSTGIVHKIVEDCPTKDWLVMESGTKFYRHSILLTGTKEEMNLASIEHKQIIEEHLLAKELHNSKLNLWFDKHKKPITSNS